MARTLKIINGDVIINQANGRPLMVSGVDKLRQDLNEFFSINITPYGFGSGVEQLVGTVDASDVIVGLIDRQIRSGLAEFINIQKSDGIPRDDDERISGISSIIVYKDDSDPTKFYFSVGILTDSGKTLIINNTIGGV